MKNLKYQIFFTTLFIAIGIAAVTTNLTSNVSTPIVSNQNGFLVYFSDVKANGEQDIFLVKNEKELIFESIFSAVGDKKVIDYDVTNASMDYDAEIIISCTESNKYLKITNSFDEKNNLTAKSTKSGILTVELINAVSETASYEVQCTIKARAVERTSSNIEAVELPLIKKYSTLKATSSSDSTMFRSSTYKEKIKTITFEDKINIRSNKIEEWDISEEQDNSIIAYVTPNESDSTYYNLYIQSNKVIVANKDMSHWFNGFTSVDSINGLELLNTSKVTNMSYMFCNSGYDSTSFTLDLGEKFDTSAVTNMSFMFYQTGYFNKSFTLDIGDNFDTSNVTDMSYMFFQTGMSSTVFTLDLGDNFDTSIVTKMDKMFHNTGFNSTKLNTSITIRNPETTSYTSMFYNVATKTGSKMTVNYISTTSSLVDQMIATKSPYSNVVKGVDVNKP